MVDFTVEDSHSVTGNRKTKGKIEHSVTIVRVMMSRLKIRWKSWQRGKTRRILLLQVTSGPHVLKCARAPGPEILASKVIILRMEIHRYFWRGLEDLR